MTDLEKIAEAYRKAKGGADEEPAKQQEEPFQVDYDFAKIAYMYGQKKTASSTVAKPITTLQQQAAEKYQPVAQPIRPLFDKQATSEKLLGDIQGWAKNLPGSSAAKQAEQNTGTWYDDWYKSTMEDLKPYADQIKADAAAKEKEDTETFKNSWLGKKVVPAADAFVSLLKENDERRAAKEEEEKNKRSFDYLKKQDQAIKNGGTAEEPEGTVTMRTIFGTNIEIPKWAVDKADAIQQDAVTGTAYAYPGRTEAKQEEKAVTPAQDNSAYFSMRGDNKLHNYFAGLAAKTTPNQDAPYQTTLYTDTSTMTEAQKEQELSRLMSKPVKGLPSMGGQSITWAQVIQNQEAAGVSKTTDEWINYILQQDPSLGESNIGDLGMTRSAAGNNASEEELAKQQAREKRSTMRDDLGLLVGAAKGENVTLSDGTIVTPQEREAWIKELSDGLGENYAYLVYQAGKTAQQKAEDRMASIKSEWENIAGAKETAAYLKDRYEKAVRSGKPQEVIDKWYGEWQKAEEAGKTLPRQMQYSYTGNEGEGTFDHMYREAAKARDQAEAEYQRAKAEYERAGISDDISVEEWIQRLNDATSADGSAHIDELSGLRQFLEPAGIEAPDDADTFWSYDLELAPEDTKQLMMYLQSLPGGYEKRTDTTEAAMLEAYKNYLLAEKEADILETYRYADLKYMPDFGKYVEWGKETYENLVSRAQMDREEELYWRPDAATYANPEGAIYDKDEYTYTLPDSTFTEEEFNNWCALAGSQRIDEAKEYAASVYRRNLTEVNEGKREPFREAGYKLPAWVGHAANFVTFFTSAIDYLEDVEEYRKTGYIMPRTDLTIRDMSETLDEGIVKRLNEQGTFDEGAGFLAGKGWGDAYQLVNSIINSLSVAGLGGGATSALFFFDSARSSLRENLANGMEEGQALQLSFYDALADWLGETLSVENLLNMDKTMSLARRTVTQGLVEMSEEGFTKVVQDWFHVLELGDKNEFQQNAMMNFVNTGNYDQSVRAAWKEWAKDLGFQAFGGLVSGAASAGLHEGGQKAAAGITNYLSKYDAYQGDTETLLNVAGLGENAYQGQDRMYLDRARNIFNRGGSITNKMAGRLLENAENVFTESDKSTLVETVSAWLQQNADEDWTPEQADKKAKGIVDRAYEWLDGKEVNTFATSAEKVAFEELTRQLTGKKISGKSWINTEDLMQTKAARTEAEGVLQRQHDQMRTALEDAFQKSGIQVTDGDLQIMADGWIPKLTDANTYVMAMRDAYRLGKEGMTLTQAEESSDNSGSVADVQFRHAWQLGVQAGGKQSDVAGKTTAEKNASGTEAQKSGTVSVEGLGDDLTVQGIKSDRGEIAVMVETKDGDVMPVSIKDVDFGESGIGDLLQAIQGRADAQMLYDAYQSGTDIGSYLAAWDAAKAYGKKTARATAESVMNDPALYGVSPEVIRKAFEAGRQERAAETKARAEKKTEKTEKKGPGKNGKYVSFDGGEVDGVKLHAVNRSNLSQKQKAQISAVETLAEERGIRVVFFESQADERGRFKGAYGMYKNGTIYIDVNAGMRGRNIGQVAIISTAAHELTHYIQDLSEERYQELQDFLLDHLVEWKGKTLGDLAAEKQARARKKLTMDEALDEVICDGCEMMLSRASVMQEMAEENKGLWNIVKNWLKKWVDAVKEAFQGVSAVHEEARAVEAMEAERLRKFTEMWYQGLIEASEKGAKSPAQESGETKYSIDPDFESNFDRWVTNGRPNSARLRVGTTSKALQSIDVPDMNIYWWSNSIKHAQEIHPEISDDVIKQVPDLIENPIVVMESKTQPNSITILGEVYGENGIPVMAVLRFTPSKNGVNIDKLELVNTYTKTNPNAEPSIKGTQELINSSEILYVDPDEKRTNTWLDDNRLQLPLVTTYGPIGKITLTPKDVKGNYSSDTKEPTKTPMQLAFEKAAQHQDRETDWSDLTKEEQAAEINATMTMEQAKRMVQKAFVATGIKEWYDGKYKDGDEWLKGEGSSEVSDYIENDGDLYNLYIAKNNHLTEYDYTIQDVLESYLAGTLTGKQKTAPKKVDLQSGTGYRDSRFYSNTKGKPVDMTTWDKANSRVTAKNAAEVNRARLDILLAAHDRDLAKELGITASELNKKLRSWSRYSAAALDASRRINAGVAEENRWTGIQNSAILSHMNMTDEDIRSMVKDVTGESEQYQRNYIGNTMLALDTHIDWSWLSFEFKRGPAQVNDKTVAGYYENSARHIVVGGNSQNQANTVAHEMGHALDYQWERELFGGKSSQPLTENTFAESRIVDDAGREFYRNFRSFMDGLMETGSIRSSYFMEQRETFARFVARFVEWTQALAGSTYVRNEHSWYGDKFTTAQFLEFARILQQKAAWDSKQATKSESTTKYQEREEIQAPSRGNLGYHAGDLGKAEHLNIQGRDRGTGHFGTGTYFVGEEEKVTKDSYYGKRPQHAVDFTDYNLYRVRNNDDGYRLHDALRVLDGGIKREWIRPAVEREFSIIKPTGYYDLAKKKYGEDWASGDNLLNAQLEYAKDNGIEIKTLDEFIADERFSPDDSDAKYYYEEYVKETLSEEIDKVNKEYREFMDAVWNLDLLTGMKRNKTLAALNAVADYQDATPRRSRSDSYATVFMKAMGYDGVDVRGTRLDNTEYGSVIYDVKPKTVVYQEREDLPEDRELLMAAKAEGRNAEALEKYQKKVKALEALERKQQRQQEALEKARESKNQAAVQEWQEKIQKTEESILRAQKALDDMERSPALKQETEKALAAWREANPHEAAKALREMRQEQESLRKYVELLRQEAKLTTPEERKLMPSDVRKLAQSLVKEQSSDANVDSITEQLQKLGDFMASNIQGAGADYYTRIVNQAKKIAKQIIDQAYETIDDNKEIHQGVREYLRNHTLNSEDVRGDIPDFDAWRKSKMGTLRLGKDGMSIDQAYHDLQASYGEGFFPSDVLAASDQLDRILDVLDMTQPTYSQMYSQYESWQASEALGNEIVDRLLSGEVRERESMADRAFQQRMKQLEEKYARKDKARQQALENAEDRAAWEARKRDEAEERRREERALRRQLVAEKVHELRERSIDRDKRYRKRIAIDKKVVALSKIMLENSGKRHVPDAWKETVGNFLGSIDTLTQHSGEKSRSFHLERIEALRDMAAKQQMRNEGKEDSGPQVFLDLNPYVADMLEPFLKMARDSSTGMIEVEQLSLEEMQQLEEVLTALREAVDKSDKMLADVEKGETLSGTAGETIEYLDKLGKGKTGGTLRRFLSFDNLTPVYFFKRFGPAGEKVFRGLQKGWGKLAFNAKDIIKFAEETYTAKEAKEWEKETHEFKLVKREADLSGRESLTKAAKEGGPEAVQKAEEKNKTTVKISTAQLMGLYCLAKREQARGHILQGGIRIWDIEGKRGKTTEQAERYLVTPDDLAEMENTLTDRQKEVADKLQKYMNTVGSSWGNEVSQARYGVDLFTEQNYYPISTDPMSRNARTPEADSSDLYHLLNMGFTKNTVKNARNGIVIHSILDVFANHMADMAKYNAMGLPMLDAMKWFNYVNDDPSGKFTSVRQAIEQAYGKNAEKYFLSFIQDLNGSYEGGRRGEDVGAKVISNMKVASVGANLRVAFLQPTSYVRAMAVLDPKYMLKFSNWQLLQGRKEALQYSGSAQWKDLGFFDVNVQNNLRDMIKHTDTAMDKIREASMKGAEWGDKLTWGALWNACKAETKAKTGLTGEELLKATAERFDDVIYQTQVMDSTMTRSHLMRAKGNFASMVTSFMSEPTLSYNLLLDSIVNWQNAKRSGQGMKAAWGVVGRAFTTYALSQIVASMVESLFDALRDDDDYEDFLTKWMQAEFGFDGNLIEDLAPWNKLPYLRDLVSIMQGFSNKRMDTEWMEYWMQALNAVRSDVKNGKLTWNTAYKAMKALGTMTGLPVSNAARDTVALWNGIVVQSVPDWKLKNVHLAHRDVKAQAAVKQAFQAGALSEEDAVRYLIRDAELEEDKARQLVFEWAAAENGEKKYDALLAATKAGNSAKATEERDALLAAGFSEQQIQTAVRSAAKEWYQGTADDGGPRIEKDAAIRILTEQGGMSKTEAEKRVREWTSYISSPEQLQYDEIKDAFQTGQISESRAAEMRKLYGSKSEEDAKAEVRKWACYKDTGIDYEDLDEAYVEGEISGSEAEEYLQTYGGKDASTAAETVRQWKMEADTGIKYSKLEDSFVAGDVTEERAVEYLQTYGGKSKKDAEAAVQKWIYEKETGSDYDKLRRDYVSGAISFEEAVAARTTYGGTPKATAEKTVLQWKMEADTGIKFEDLAEQYQQGSVSKAEAEQYMVKYGGLAKLEAQERVQQWGLYKDHGIDYNDMQTLFVGKELSESNAVSYLQKYGGKTKTEAEETVRQWRCERETGVKYSELQTKYVGKELNESKAVSYLQKYGGKTKAEAEETVRKWSCEKDTGIKYTDLKDAYLGGQVNKQKAGSMLVKYGGYSEEDATEKLMQYDFAGKDANLQDISVHAAVTYYDSLQPAGITKQMWYDAWKTDSNTYADKDAKGKSISGSKRNKMAEYINKLNLTNAQKDLLFVGLGYAESSLKKTPWH